MAGPDGGLLARMLEPIVWRTHVATILGRSPVRPFGGKVDHNHPADRGAHKIVGALCCNGLRLRAERHQSWRHIQAKVAEKYASATTIATTTSSPAATCSAIPIRLGIGHLIARAESREHQRGPDSTTVVK
jgi:hypothetical protein